MTKGAPQKNEVTGTKSERPGDKVVVERLTTSSRTCRRKLMVHCLRARFWRSTGPGAGALPAGQGFRDPRTKAAGGRTLGTG